MTGRARGQLAVAQPVLALETYARRLSPWLPLAGTSQEADGTPPASISWFGPAGLGAERPGSEAVVQALSGLMALHGQEWGRPRRIGLEVASVAAGVLAAQGALATSIGRSRGRNVAPVHTSVLQAGLLAASHYVAAATCPKEESYLPPAGPAPGPPFQSADGCWYEIETLDPEAWRSFWYALGADGADLGGAWAHFRARYYTATCPLPVGLHEATATRTLAETAELARSCGVSLSPLRHYGEVLADPGSSPGHPVVQTVAPGGDPTAIWPAEPLESRMGLQARTALGARADASDLPLTGIRVVEATTRMQGPLAGLLLQLLGAEVTKVEPPGGDFGRLVAPLAGDTGSFFSCFNRGKQVAEIDLAALSGRTALRDLVGDADVFLHNWRPGKAASWGLEAADLAGRGAGLVYAEASGWGEAAGPSRLLGTDFLVQAYAGVGDGVRPQGEVAAPARITLTDFMGALNTCEGVLTGLWQRERTGRGAQVGTSLLAGAMTLQAHVLEALAAGSENRRRAGRPLWGPLDEPIPTAEGTLVVTVEDDGTLLRLAQVCGGADEAEAAAALARGSAHHWEERLLDAGIACAALADDPGPAALVSDPRLAGLFEPLAGSSWVPASPWRFIAE
ncbi:MAG: CoA transferase [Acidimicrobiales bacterium]